MHDGDHYMNLGRLAQGSINTHLPSSLQMMMVVVVVTMTMMMMIVMMMMR